MFPFRGASPLRPPLSTCAVRHAHFPRLTPLLPCCSRYTLLGGAPGESPVGLSDAGRVGKLPWMDGRVTGGAVVIDTEVQHISFSQKEYNVVENTPNGYFIVTLVRDPLFAATEVTVRVATTDLTAIGAWPFAANSLLSLRRRHSAALHAHPIVLLRHLFVFASPSRRDHRPKCGVQRAGAHGQRQETVRGLRAKRGGAHVPRWGYDEGEFFCVPLHFTRILLTI